MTKRTSYALLGGILTLCSSTSAEELQQTVGLFQIEPESYIGYTLLTPMLDATTYLIDNYGRVVHSWQAEDWPGKSCYFLEDGTLLRPAYPSANPNPNFPGGGLGGYVEVLEWDGTVVWEYEYSSESYLLHHDVAILPNGNILMIAWEKKTFDETVAVGRDPASLPDNELWPDHVIEVERTGPKSGDIVWEWHVWDHLIQDFDPTKDNYGVVGDHPELVDINYFSDDPLVPAADWLHTNGVDYNADLDQILLSISGTDEFFVLDHSTTTEEAANHTGGDRGHGGDILYRWGNPQAYRAGGPEDQELFSPHQAVWIKTGLPGGGNVLVQNTRRQFAPPDDFSTIDEVVPPVDEDGNYPELAPGTAYGPDAPVWRYTADPPSDFFTVGGAAVRLPNGNTLIDNGSFGTLFEVTPAEKTVWEYTSPVTLFGVLNQGDALPPHPGISNLFLNTVFNVVRYAADYPGLVGKDLTAGGPIERYPPRGDFHDDGSVDLDDHAHFTDCLTGPCGDPPCEPPLYTNPWCTVADFDADWDVDLFNAARFQNKYAGP